MDRVGRMPVIRGGFAAGAVGCGVVAAGCAVPSAVLVAVGLSLLGGAGAIIQLTAAAAGGDVPAGAPRARHVVRPLRRRLGRDLGPVVFGPLFAHRSIDAHGLVGPWLVGIPFMIVGLGIVWLVRPDPKEIAASYPAERVEPATAAPLREILRRPGVPAAVLAVVASFAVMASVMNLAGLRRRRARPPSGRRVHDDQRPHPRDVRADPHRRRHRRPLRAPPLPRRRACC